MNKLNIDLINIKYIDLHEIEIEINKFDLKKVLKNKTIYEIEIKDYKGLIKSKHVILSFKYLLIFSCVALFFICLLSNLIFRIDIVTNDSKMQRQIEQELKLNGIKLYSFKKNYDQLQVIKEKIKEKYKDEIDWIEIELLGSKYIVRYEPRIKTDLNKDTSYQNIVARKNAIIYSLDISSGQIMKNRFDYVKKGDVIVSGYIYLNEKVKDTVKATGKVYGEVWYKVTVKDKLNRKIVKKTGNKKNSLVFKFLSKEYQPFNMSEYEDYKTNNTVLLKNNLLPISINFQKQEEIKIKIENKTYDDAIGNTINKAKKKISKCFKEGEFIKDYKVLMKRKIDNEIEVELFLSVVEDISEYRKIEEYIELEEEVIE